MARTKGAAADKWWRDAIRVAVQRQEDDDGKKRKRISLIADKLCRLAMDGDVQAIKEIGDRLDGRPQQAVSVGGDPENPIVHSIERRIVRQNPED